eukprot:3374671-Pleurochrysis_carterae.AAC.3
MPYPARGPGLRYFGYVYNNICSAMIIMVISTRVLLPTLLWFVHSSFSAAATPDALPRPCLFPLLFPSLLNLMHDWLQLAQGRVQDIDTSTGASCVLSLAFLRVQEHSESGIPSISCAGRAYANFLPVALG